MRKGRTLRDLSEWENNDYGFGQAICHKAGTNPKLRMGFNGKRYKRAMRLTAQINALSFDDVERVRKIFSELTGQAVDETFTLIPPFYSAHGLDIRVGTKVFINQCCTFYDMGGLEIGDYVMIGPNVNIITTGHPLAPSQRRAYVETKPIKIGNNVWIATGATIIEGVTVGDNSVVAAGAVVTKDVPANTLVGGNPARVIRSLDDGPVGKRNP